MISRVVSSDVLKKYNYRSENQKFILMCKTQSDDEHIYSKTNIEAALAAQKNLSDAAFRLYHRLSLHNPEYYFGLSQKEVENSTGLKAKRYYKAADELVEKHYLEPVDGYPDMYNFFEYPQKDNPAYVVTSCRNGRVPPAELGGASCPLGETPPAELGRPPLPNWEEPPCHLGGTNTVYISQDTVTNTTKDTVTNTSCEREGNFIIPPEVESEVGSSSGDLYSDSEPVAYDYIDKRLLWAIEDKKRKEEEVRLENLKSGTGGIYLAMYERLIDKLFPKQGKKPKLKFMGWDEERNEPIIVWAPCHVPTHLMKQGVDELCATWDGYNAATSVSTSTESKGAAIDIEFAELAEDDDDLPF